MCVFVLCADCSAKVCGQWCVFSVHCARLIVRLIYLKEWSQCRVPTPDWVPIIHATGKKLLYFVFPNHIVFRNLYSIAAHRLLRRTTTTSDSVPHFPLALAVVTSRTVVRFARYSPTVFPDYCCHHNRLDRDTCLSIVRKE